MSPLGAKIVEVLREGGPRKHAILLALARHHGSSVLHFKNTINGLIRGRTVERFRRHGGIHYRLALAR